MTEFTGVIEEVGARGDGIVRHDGRTFFLPFTAPGDMVRARLQRDGKAELIDIVSPGARRNPTCPHFGQCGGCSLQHLADDAYEEAKRQFVREALGHRGFDPEIVAPLIRIPAASRRRARFAWTPEAIGFRQRVSHRTVDMHVCPVLHPSLVAVAAALRALGRSFLQRSEKASVALTRTDSGIDLLLDLPRQPDLERLEMLAQFAAAQDLARLSWRVGRDAPTPVTQRRSVQVVFSGVSVDLPPDCFLQASVEAETAMRDLVLAGIGEARRVADLFCGVGTFSFPLAMNAKVHAVDAGKPQILALAAATRRAGLGMTAERRDLDARPLLAADLQPFDAVVVDPPYAGALAQTRELARSTVQRIVAVSCNPATFARDARMLADGGYRLTRVIPVDQFLWSAEIELVAYLER